MSIPTKSDKFIILYITSKMLCFVDRVSLYNLVNKDKLGAQFFLVRYFFSLRVSGDYVPIIRRNNCVYATLGTSYSVWMTVWYAGWILACIPDSHPHRVTNTKCRIDTVISADDGHTVARNMKRKEINILRKIVHQVGFIYKMTLKSLECMFIYEDKIFQVVCFLLGNSPASEF